MSFTLKKKTPPACEPGYKADPCWKCSGTGFFCMGTNNGSPYSLTGFDCYPCGATGYKIIRYRDYGKTPEQIAKRDAANEKRRATKAAKVEAERDAKAEANKAALGPFWDRLMAVPFEDGILGDLRAKSNGFLLSEKQIALAQRLLDERDARMAEKAARDAAKVWPPEGRRTVSGKLVAIKDVDSQYGSYRRATLACEGFLLNLRAGPGIGEDDKGKTFSLTCEITAKEIGFAFGNRARGWKEEA